MDDQIKREILDLQTRILSLLKKDIEIKLKSNYSFNSDKYTYDPDSSPLAWDYYLIVHKDEFNIEIEQLSNGFDARMPNGFAKPGGQVRRIIAVYKNITIAGDCAFNFNDKKLMGFWEILGLDEKESMKSLLLLCCFMHHSVFNFTLMPRTGGLNDVKGVKICDTQGFDRLDAFLFRLNDFYNSRNLEHNILSVASDENKKALYSFLASEVGNFENYCNLFYHISSKETKDSEGKNLYDKLLENGKKEINNSDSLLQYIELAVEFWEHQANHYDKCIEELSMKGDE